MSSINRVGINDCYGAGEIRQSKYFKLENSLYNGKIRKVHYIQCGEEQTLIF